MDLVLQNRIESSSTPEPNSGCWLWDGSLSTAGYGTTCVDGKQVSTHRASYAAFVGEIPSGAIVRHKCDTKSCVNPDHLLAGTHSDNVFDSVRMHPNRHRNVSKVDLKTRIEERSVPEPNSGCWLWLGAVMALGYGELLVNGKKTLAHRASYSAFVGEIPRGALILHKCATRLCVNPHHLEIGSHSEKRRARTDCYSVPKMGKPTATLIDRFDALSVFEPNTGCQLWIGTVTKTTGYGEINVNGKKETAHRASWVSHRGEIPAGMVVMHRCDVRTCINIDHLSVGSRKDNSVDMAKKGRGFLNKLTHEQRSERMKRAIQTIGPDRLKAIATKRMADRTPEQRSASARKNWTPERRAKARAYKPSQATRDGVSAAKKAFWAKLTAEERSEHAKRRASNTPFAQHSERSRKMWASMTPEARAEHGRKVGESRRRAAKKRREGMQ